VEAVAETTRERFRSMKKNTSSQKEKTQNIHAINIYTIKQKEKKVCKV
jgi:hypothetical protein